MNWFLSALRRLLSRKPHVRMQRNALVSDQMLSADDVERIRAEWRAAHKRVLPTAPLDLPIPPLPEFSIAKLDLGPNDILVVKSKTRLSREAANYMREILREQLAPGRKCLVLEGEIDLAVLTQPAGVATASVAQDELDGLPGVRPDAPWPRADGNSLNTMPAA